MLLIIIYRMAYEHLVKKLSHKIEETRSDVKKISDKMIDRAASSSPDPTPPSEAESAPEAEYATIPLHPHRENFTLINHWMPETWSALRHSKKGTLLQQGPDPINVLFWEDDAGNVIPPSRRLRVTRDARSIWQDMHDKGKRLGPLSKVGWEVREEFRTCMEARHPWLRLCDDHWKVDQIWSNHYSGWTPAGASKGKGPETLKRERSAEEDEAGPIEKRPKTIIQQRPLPKPITKQVAKVSPIFLTSTLLLKTRPDEPTVSHLSCPHTSEPQ